MEKPNQITAIFYSLLLVLDIDKEALFWFFIIMGFDMLFGAIKSITVSTLKFSTKVFFFGALRKLCLVAIVLFIATLGKGLGYDNMRVITTKVIQLLMITEGISVLYCFRSILTKKESKPEDFISNLIDKLIIYLGNKLNKISEVLNDKNGCL